MSRGRPVGCCKCKYCGNYHRKDVLCSGKAELADIKDAADVNQEVQE